MKKFLVGTQKQLKRLPEKVAAIYMADIRTYPSCESK